MVLISVDTDRDFEAVDMRQGQNALGIVVAICQFEAEPQLRGAQVWLVIIIIIIIIVINNNKNSHCL